jgi:hypothetical protein
MNRRVMAYVRKVAQLPTVASCTDNLTSAAGCIVHSAMATSDGEAFREAAKAAAHLMIFLEQTLREDDNADR